MPELFSAHLFCDVEMTGDLGTNLEGDLYVTGSGNDELELDAQFDGEVGQQASQTGTIVQDVGMTILVNGQIVAYNSVIGEVEVTRDLDQSLQSWRFAVPLETPSGPFGSPFSHVGPPLCKKEISIYGTYRKSDGTLASVPLEVDGIVHRSVRRGGRSGFVEEFEGVDAGGRVDQKLVTISLPAGHGFSRDQVVRKVLQDVEEDDISLDPCGQMMKEFTLVDAEWIGPCTELLDADQRTLLWNSEGEATNPRYGKPQTGEQVRFSFTEADCALAEEVTCEHQADIITQVVLTGSAPKIVDECLVKTATQRNERKAIYQSDSARYRWYTDGFGDLQAEDIGLPSATADPILIGLDIIEKVTKCDVVVFERTLTYGYYNPEIGRYAWTLVDEGPPDVWEWVHIPSGYSNSNTQDDGAAFESRQERWMLLGVSELWHSYLQQGFRQGYDGLLMYGPSSGELNVALNNLSFPEFVGQAPSFPYVGYTTATDDGQLIGGHAGMKIGTVALNWEMRIPRAAVKGPKVHSEDFAELNYISGVDVTGNKEAFTSPGTRPYGFLHRYYPHQATGAEMLLISSVEFETVTPNMENYIVEKRIDRWGWGAHKGNTYLYGDGYVYADEAEDFQYVGGEIETYMEAGESSHDIIRSAWDIDGKPLPVESNFGVEGNLPALEFMPQVPFDASLYESPEEMAELAKTAKRTENKEMEVTVYAPELEYCHMEKIHRGSFQWAENEDELERYARAIIEEASAARVTFTIAGANFFIREGDVIHLTYRPLAIDHDMRVRSVSWSRGAINEPLLTRVEAKLYGW